MDRKAQDTWEATTRSERDELLDRARRIEHPLFWQRFRQLVAGAEQLQQMSRKAPWVAHWFTDQPDGVLRTHLGTAWMQTRLGRYEHTIAPYVFGTATALLIVAGVLIMGLTGGDQFRYLSTFTRTLGSLWGVGLLLFWADFAITLYLARQERLRLHRHELLKRGLALVFPPLRIGSRHIMDIRRIWLPFWGWCEANEPLLDRLRKAFGIPMIVIAMLIIPVLIVEWKFMEDAQQRFPAVDWNFLLEMVQASIWIAFTFEFLVMFSASDEKVDYCKRNWIDLLIIFLPLVSFIRTFRLAQVARVKYLARTWKLRGVVTKARQGFIVADFFRRLLTAQPHNRAKTLRKKLRDNRREREALERELMELAEHTYEAEKKRKK
ncbi:hypothetical protein SAMN05421823_101456 [Catalinimonas alkaloidigena]|uniref:Voltage-gated potassium channel n=1 Tax=Catalinimonas alkaloidigena TaxID=1075417 RepID=A0A1G8XRR1_9BACT|nr:hypothetical protein [Catalinimonas alkaloidigena]SDJ93249.1 hypothetical protein SAMN05421823_101456 [Catalinimonas alkaloidigena]